MQTPVGQSAGHGPAIEGCRLLMAREDKLDLRCPQRLDDFEIFFARNPKDAVDPSFSSARTRRSEPSALMPPLVTFVWTTNTVPARRFASGKRRNSGGRALRRSAQRLLDRSSAVKIAVNSSDFGMISDAMKRSASITVTYQKKVLSIPASLNQRASRPAVPPKVAFARA